MGKHSKTEKKVRWSFRLYPSEMEKVNHIRDTFGYTLQQVIEILFNEEMTLNGLYESTFRLEKIDDNGEDERVVS